MGKRYNTANRVILILILTKQHMRRKKACKDVNVLVMYVGSVNGDTLNSSYSSLCLLFPYEIHMEKTSGLFKSN